MAAFTRKPSSLLLALALGVATPAIVQAQETTSEIRGQVLDSAGQPVAGATVEILDTRTGARRSLTTNAAGSYVAHDLPVGGLYSVSASSALGEQKQTDIYLTLGARYVANLVLGAQGLADIVVVGRADAVDGGRAVGPSASYTLHDLETAPAANRDLKDVVRFDPRIYIDESFGDGVQCGGGNTRFNSLTVDGVRLNDNFGLNSNGYPTERMPFSYDAIEQVSVELAPFDVQYGGFTACNINAVTKSGENEFHGSVFYDYTSNDLTGDSLRGEPIDLGNFTEQRYGATIGGPILKDRLFFLVSAEKLEGVSVFSRGPAGSDRTNEVLGVSQAQLDRIVQLAQDLYDYDPGSLPASLPVEDEKLLVKLDWYISDTHRAAFTYTYNDGYNISESDGGASALSLSNHYYERGATLNAYVGQLFSNWTDRFSTEMKVGYSKLDNRQNNIGDPDFGEVQIRTENDPDGDGNPSRATVFIGNDDSRHANKLAYDTFLLKLAGNYLAGNHALTAGYEMEALDVFNLFIQEAEGEYQFASIDAFAAGTPTYIIYENAAGTNDKNDAAAQFKYTINTLYAQDEYRFDSLPLTLTAGLRYDFYTSSDLPTENPNFVSAYGFSNAQNMDGLSLLQPRLALNWTPLDRLRVYAGAGLYSGGNPNVWISNNYSNNGVTQLEVQDRSGTSVFDLDYTGQGRPVYDIPQDLFDQVASGVANSPVNVLDPDFKVPSEWKYAAGLVYGDLRDWQVQLDYLHTVKQDAAFISDISRVKVGEAIDGRPIYDSANGRRQDFMLTNAQGDSGSSQVLAVSASKSFEFGLDAGFGYAFTQAEDVNPMTSSVAFSNYANYAVYDLENPGTATSNYEIPNRFTLKLAYEHAFFGDYNSRATLFASRNEGRPFSYVFDNFNAQVGDTTFTDRHLLYMPTGIDDPNVIFDPGFDSAAFFDFARAQGLERYAGKTVPRNAFYSHWWTKVDLKLEQQLPGLRKMDKASMFLYVDNLLNLINDEWGTLQQAGFPQTAAVVAAEIDEATGRYVFKDFVEYSGQETVTNASLWQLRLGVRYQF